MAYGSNKSAGVAVLKGNYKGKILKSKAHSHGRWLILVVEDDSNVLILGNIYGDNYTLQNRLLLQNFREQILDFFKIYPNAQLILGGDWNTINDPFVDCFPPRISRQSQYIDIFNLCSQLNCRDEWRHRNFDKIDFTWSNKDRSIQSRIDFWLTSVELGNQIQQTDIVPSVFSDHKMIHLVISLGDTRTRGSNFNYWKLNNSLLEDVQFKDKVKSVIKRCYNNAKISGLYGTNWEIMKYEIRKFAVSRSKEIAKAKRNKENILIQNIMDIYDKQIESEQDKNLLIKLQLELEQIYEYKAKGVFIRSRRKWLEKGESNSKYFFNLERKNGDFSSLKKLKINDSLIVDPKLISNFVATFYEKLYSQNNNSDNAAFFLDSLKKMQKL